MGRKGNWIFSMKKSLNPEAKEKNKQESAGKSKKKWFRKKKKRTAGLINKSAETLPSVVPHPAEPAKVSTVDKEPKKNAYAVAQASAKAAEATFAFARAGAEVVATVACARAGAEVLGTVASARAGAEVVATVASARPGAEVVIRLTAMPPHLIGKSKEEIAAIKIQTAFRGYMGRRTLRALRGLTRLKTMMQGQAIKHQTANTLKSMQALARVQAQVRERRQKMAEENLANQKVVQQKYAREQAKALEKSQKNSRQNGDGWDSSVMTKEQIDAKMQSRHEAAIRRERTMAYAFTHQQAWKAASMSAHTMFMDVNNPHWGWSWLERWLAARPWENAVTPDKDLSVENSPRIDPSKTTNEITKSYACYLQNITSQKPSPTSVPKKPRSPAAARLSTSKPNAAARKLRSASPKSSPRMSMWGQDDDAKGTLSLQSEQQSRRNSATGSSVRDDESLMSFQTVQSYMAPTECAKARSSRSGNRTSVTADRSSVSSVKKRGSHTASPARSRRSTSSIADINSLSEHT